nr:uncharacterized protein LOC111502961 [Leptinotarsa decemlineata]
MIIRGILVYIVAILRVQGDVESPCPKYFLFEPNKSEDDRWYGLITLESKVDIMGVTLKVKFDKSIIQLGNWLGQVDSNSDNTEFTIRNNQRQIKANKPTKEEIFVVFDPYYDLIPPKLTEISLNGRELCPNYEEEEQTIPMGNQESSRPTIVLNINIPQCGTTIITTTPLITEGDYSRPGQWPWHAALYNKEEGKKKYICGGTLISQRHILTAAHCAVKKSDCTINCSPTPKDPEDILITLGKYGFFVQGRNEQILEVSTVTIHPQYNTTNFFNDIAILHLKTPAQFTNFVRPCCIWEEDPTLDSVVGRIGTAVGWGRDHKNNEQTDLLMQAEMPVVDTLTCIYAHRDVFAHYTNSNNFCAGFRNGTSVCNGDSGGGLVFRKRSTSGGSTVWQIRGIVSNTIAKEGRVCDPNYYVIFTDVAKYVEWIKSVTIIISVLPLTIAFLKFKIFVGYECRLLSKMVKYLIIFVLFLNTVSCQSWVSPCPKFFTYEPRNPNEPDRWYGRITLMSPDKLTGVWLRVIFDKPTIQLGNWFGEVKTEDNVEYLIKNPKKKLEPNAVATVRFYVKHNVNEIPPQVVSFRLNAKTVCPEGTVTTEATTSGAQLFISEERSTKPTLSKPELPNVMPPNTGNNFMYPGQSLSMNGNSDDDDFFMGDFALFGRPQKPPVLDNSVCGTIIKHPRPLITHGQETHEGEFPWHAALYHARGIDLTYICGSSLISANHLITVAHCVTRRKTQSTLSTSSLVVYLGKYYLKIWSNPGIQDKNVEKIIVHPKYNSQTFSFDIAILKLSSPAKITDYVRPICLWNEQTDLGVVVGKAGTVVGWGYDESGKVTEQLTKAQMPIVTQETCIYSFPDFYSRFTSDHTFCAGFNNGAPGNRADSVTGTSVCNGDSGGGMVFPKTGSNPNNPVWQLRGMVSISVALQNQFKCDSSHYVVFTDIAKYLDWIKQALEL